MEEQKEVMVKEQKKTSGFAIVGFILALIGLVLSFIPIVNTISYPLGAVAVVFGIIALVKKGKKGLAIAALVIAVVCLIMATVMKVVVTAAVVDSVDEALEETESDIDDVFDDMTGENTDEILGRDVEVTMGEFTIEKGEYFDETKLEVTVKNLCDEKQSFDIQIEAVDAEGSRIDTDYIYANDLGAGQKQTFELFTLVPEDKYEAFQNAKFNVVEVSKY